MMVHLLMCEKHGKEAGGISLLRAVLLKLERRWRPGGGDAE